MNRSRILWLTVFVAVPMNFLWEMIQMHAYSGMRSFSLKTMLFCGTAAIGDAAYAAFIYWLGSWLSGDALWVDRLSPDRVAGVLAAGLAAAITIEHIGIRVGAWRYSSSMPMIPLAGIGLWPALQLMTLPLMVFLLIRPKLSRPRHGAPEQKA